MNFRSVHLKTIHYITEILLKVALNIITLTLTHIRKNTGVPIPIIDRGTNLTAKIKNNNLINGHTHPR